MARRFSHKMIGLMCATAVMLASTTAIHAQESTSTQADSNQLFVADGIDAPIIAQAATDGASITGSTLLLELIDLAPDTEMAPHDTTSPELFSVLSGVLVFRDNFGFASLAEAGSTISLNAGTQYTIANEESEPGRVLRLRIVGGDDTSPAATPVADEGGPTVLVQIPLQDLQLESGRIYLARVQFGAGANSGEQSHAGPIGLYIESGAINVVSPSGLVGTIGEGQAVSLPVETPLSASTGETEAVAYIAGVTGSEGATFERVASADDSNTESTAAESVLEDGQSWHVDTAELSLKLQKYSREVRLNLTYSNIGESPVDLNLDRDSLSVTDDAGGVWLFVRSDCQAQPGQAAAYCSAYYEPPAGTPRGPIELTIRVVSLGDVQDATWQVEVDW